MLQQICTITLAIKVKNITYLKLNVVTLKTFKYLNCGITFNRNYFFMDHKISVDLIKFFLI